MTIETKMYVVANGKMGDLEYLDFDSASGGYPYANSWLGDMTSDLQRAVDWLTKARSTFVGFENPKVYEIVLREVNITEWVAGEKVIDALLDSLTEDQKQILRRKL